MDQETKAWSGIFEGNKNGASLYKIWNEEARVPRRQTSCHRSYWNPGIDWEPKKLIATIG